MQEVLQAELTRFLSAMITPARLALFERVLIQRTRHVAVLVAGVENVQDISAVMRSCECFGIQDFHLQGDGRAFAATRGVAVGASKWLNTAYYDTSAQHEAITKLREENYRIVSVTGDEKAPSITTLDISEPTVFCFTDSKEIEVDWQLQRIDRVRIPTVGFAGGFNLSVRAAVSLAWVRAQFGEQKIAWELSQNARAELLLEWLLSMRRKQLPKVLDRFCQVSGYDLKDLVPLSWNPRLARLLHFIHQG